MGCAEEIALRTYFQNVDKHRHSLTFSLLLTVKPSENHTTQVSPVS